MGASSDVDDDGSGTIEHEKFSEMMTRKTPNRDPQDEIPLGSQVRRQSGGVEIRTVEDYCAFMSGETAYGDMFEASVAAWLLQVELTIYVVHDRDSTKLRAVATGVGYLGGTKRRVLLLNHLSQGGCHYNFLMDRS